MCTRRTQELRSLPTTPASFTMPYAEAHPADVTKGHLGCHPHHGSWGCCEWRGQTLAGARLRPDGSVTHAASYRPGPCPGSLGTSPLGPTHPTHSPAASSPPPPRAHPGRGERESKGGCQLESAGSAPMKVGSAAAGGKDGRGGGGGGRPSLTCSACQEDWQRHMCTCLVWPLAPSALEPLRFRDEVIRELLFTGCGG